MGGTDYTGPIYKPTPDDGFGFSPIVDPQQLWWKYQWRTRGENCSMCDALAGRIYIMDRWLSSGLMPGFHLNCNCYLACVGKIEGPGSEIPESNIDIFGDLHLWGDDKVTGYLLDPSYQPYNVLFTNQVMNYVQQGYTLKETFDKLYSKFRVGFFEYMSNLYHDFFQWKVFSTLNNFFNVGNFLLTVPYNPLPSYPVAQKPVNTHNDPIHAHPAMQVTKHGAGQIQSIM